MRIGQLDYEARTGSPARLRARSRPGQHLKPDAELPASRRPGSAAGPARPADADQLGGHQAAEQAPVAIRPSRGLPPPAPLPGPETPARKSRARKIPGQELQRRHGRPGLPSVLVARCRRQPSPVTLRRGGWIPFTRHGRDSELRISPEKDLGERSATMRRASCQVLSGGCRLRRRGLPVLGPRRRAPSWQSRP